MKKRILSMLLLLVMLVTAVPFAAVETAAVEATPTGKEEEYVDLDTLYVQNGLISHFSVFGKNASTVDLSAGTWTDLVAGKTATFGDKSVWSVNANGSVGFTTYRGALVNGKADFDTKTYDNYQKASTRLNFGLSLLPDSDFTVEYMAMYKPLYVYDANQADHIAREEDGSLMESFNQENFSVDLHVTRPIDQMGWFTSYVTYLDSDRHYWSPKNAPSYAEKTSGAVGRGTVHWRFYCPTWSHGGNGWQTVGGNVNGEVHAAGVGLNKTNDAFQTNNVIRTYGIYLDETLTVADDGTRTTTALFGLYRNAQKYNDNSNKLNSTANADSACGYRDIEAAYPDSNFNFWLSSTRATDFFTVRIYDVALNDAEKLRNHGVDVLNYYGAKILKEYASDEAFLTRVTDILADEELLTDPLAYVAKAGEVQDKVEKCYPKFNDLNDLYVKNGLTALYTAFQGDGAYLTESGNDIIWQNRLYGSMDATFKNTGWTYNAERGGVGYDVIYGTVDTAKGTFSVSGAQNNYDRGNRLNLGLDLLPTEDFTLEYVANYRPVLSYDSATGGLVDAYATGISITMPTGTKEPVDTVGFLSSYTTQHGGLFYAKTGVYVLGLLRWRSMDKAGYKTWGDNGYGWGDNLVTENRASRTIETYAITRDEETAGDIVTATYTHRLNGASVCSANYSSVNTTGANRYYTFEDDTEFYLSYKLGTTFYALRVYNRVLSAEEQRQNRAVDLLRYYDITLPEAVWTDEDLLSALYAFVATQSFAYDALDYAANKVKLQAIVSTAITRDTLVDKFASPEHLTALFTAYVPETVDLANCKWTDLVAGKTATFSYGGTNYWRVNADGSVGYTSFRGALSDGVVATASTDNYQQANNRLQFGLSLLPESDFSVEYFAKYKPLYVYDANEADYIARDEYGNARETYSEELEVKLHVTYPIDQLGWFTSVTSLMDTTKHYWSPATGTAYADRTHVLQRGSVHWFFDCPNWSYQGHNNWYVGGLSHVPSAGLNITTDAYQANNEINTYGIYLDETLSVAEDESRTTTALFSLYRNAALYNSNAGTLNSTANAKGTSYYDIDTALTSSHNFWLSSTRATDFFTVRIYDKALTDAEKKHNYAVDLLLYYGVALTDEMWENDAFMSILRECVLEEKAVTDALERAAIGAKLQKTADAILSDLSKVKEMTSLYAKSESLKALFTTEAVSSVSVTGGCWRDYVGGNIASLGNASEGYWKLRADGAVGYDVIYGEIDGNGYGTYTETSDYNNYSDYGTRLEFGIDLLPKGDFTVEYLAEYRPVYAADPDGNPAIEAMEYLTSLPSGQQYGETMYVPVDSLGYLTSYTTQRDGVFSGRTHRGEVRWVVHEPVIPSGLWDYAYFTQSMSANADIFQTRNEIRAYGISRVKTTDASELVTAQYTLFRDTAQYATASFSRKTYEDRVTTTANSENPYNPPVITDFAKDDTGYFYLSERMSTDFYSVRIYDTALTAEDYARNRFVDLLYFYDVEIPSYLTKEELLLQLAAEAKDIGFGADPLSYEAGRAALLGVIQELEKISAENTLYVQDGLVALYTAFVGDGDLLSASDSGIVWQNRILGEKDATFEKTGWSYGNAMGGVGYDVIHGTVDTAKGTFSVSGAQNNYDRGNRLNLGLDLLPTEDFTLEYVANYRPVLSYDSATGGLVDAYATGISITMPTGTKEPVDTVGFLSSYTTQHGGLFYAKTGVYVLGLLRWRSMDKAGYKTWGDNGYGWGDNLVTENRASRTIETYAITRDEETAGDIVTATYTHRLNGASVCSANYSSVNITGANRYYSFEDDTEFYLSYKLGTTFYAVRVYDRVLSEAEQKQNRMADILNYYGVAIPDSFLENQARYDYVLSLCETLDFEEDAARYAEIKSTLQTAVIGNDKQVTVTVGDRSTTEIVYGDSYPLPKSVEGTNLFAWHKLDAEGNKIASYAPGEVVQLTERETTFRALVLSAPETVYGVSVKVMPEDGFGMRFTSTVDKSEMKAIIDEYGGENIQLSILITPKAYVDRAGGFTREKLRNYVVSHSESSAKAYIEIQSYGFYKVDEDVCTIAGTIYKFSEITIEKNPAFAAIGCIDVDTDGNGTYDKTVYGSFASSTARSPKKTVESVRYMGLEMTSTQKKWVDDFLKNYTDRTYGQEGDKTVAVQRQNIKDAFDKAMKTTVEYTVHPFYEDEVVLEKYKHIQAISFDGLDVNGKKTRIFAYVGLPEGASAENPVPAMVLVHGGGGHAYMEWVRLWNERGYAAIAMETVGHFPVTPGAGAPTTPGTKGDYAVTEREFPQYILDVIDEENYTIAPDREMKSSYAEVDEHWQYHGLSAVILSHNVLRQNAAIDSTRIGTIGVSWGGTMVSQVIGYDTRFAFAIPIYGTAYLSEPAKSFAHTEYVYDLWAAERNLDNFKNPIMWFAWADDNNFGMDSYTKSYLHSRKNNPKTTLVVLADWRHSHPHAWEQEHGYAFADSICFPEASDYASFIWEPSGQNALSQVRLPEGATNVSVRYHYLTEPIAYAHFNKYFESNWLTETWKTDNKTLTIDPATGKITGTVPENVRHYYISVLYTVDGKTLETSSSFVHVR